MESIFLLPKTKGVFDMELKAIQLTKQYGSKTAVNHLNLSLSNGVYGLLGANGAGKTTLMRLLCDIQTPTSGKITLDGKNISVLGEKYRNLLGYLPQQFGYYPDFTAWDFLMYLLKTMMQNVFRDIKQPLKAMDFGTTGSCQQTLVHNLCSQKIQKTLNSETQSLSCRHFL